MGSSKTDPFTLKAYSEGKWQARGHKVINGKRYQKVIAIADRDEAWEYVATTGYPQWLRAAKAGTLQSQTQSREKLLIGSVADEWIAAHERQGTAAKTIRGYKGNVRILKRHFLSVKDIDEQAVEDFINQRLDEVGRNTVKHDLVALRGILKRAKKDKLIVRLPQWDLDKGEKGTPKKGMRGKPIDITNEEAEAILALLPERTKRAKFPVRDFCRLLWETGLRPTLWLRVQPRVHFNPPRVVEIDGEQVETCSINTMGIDKAKWERDVPLTPEAVLAMWRVWDQAKELPHNVHGLLFPDLNGQPYDSAPIRSGSTNSNLLKEAAIKVLGARRGSKMHPSIFRRAHINDLKHNMSDVDLPTEMYLVGHTQTATNDRYTGTQFEHAAKALHRAVGKKAG